MSVRTVSIEGGVACLSDGTTVDLLEIQTLLASAAAGEGAQAFSRAAEKLALLTGCAPDLPKTRQLYSGCLKLKGAQVQVDFEVPQGATRLERDAACLVAIAKKAEVDYCFMGDLMPSTASTGSEKAPG